MTDRVIQYHSDRYHSEINTDVSMLPEADRALIKFAMNKEWTNPRFKLKWFVGQAQVTPFAKCRQWLLEIKTKEESIENMEYELAKLDVEYDRFKRVRDESPDPLDKRSAEIEMWRTERLRYMSRRRLQDWYLERQVLIDLLQEFLASDEAKLKDGSGRTYMDILNTEEEDKFESELWTNRLAKQAATDLVFYGRINSGNMDAILSMHPDQQAETLALAINFGTQLQRYTGLLQQQVDEKLGMTKPGTTIDNKDLTTPSPIEFTTIRNGETDKSKSFDEGSLDVYNI